MGRDGTVLLDCSSLYSTRINEPPVVCNVVRYRWALVRSSAPSPAACNHPLAALMHSGKEHPALSNPLCLIFLVSITLMKFKIISPAILNDITSSCSKYAKGDVYN